MNLPDLHLWEQAALPPSHAPPAPRPPRRRPEPRDDARSILLRRAWLIRARIRAAAKHGLYLSLFFGAPLGWSVAQSTVFAEDPSVAMQQCPELASFLPPVLQRQLQAHKARGTLSASEKGTLGMKVCDPALRVVLKPMLGGVSDLNQLREMAKSAAKDGGGQPVPVLKSMLAGSPLGD